eukprot:Rhum_TRINITY_DN14828_c4_g1::Rhum_TRINITY_DN14828_c4_g1_i1::g.123809::m.123809
MIRLQRRRHPRRRLRVPRRSKLRRRHERVASSTLRRMVPVRGGLAFPGLEGGLRTLPLAPRLARLLELHPLRRRRGPLRVPHRAAVHAAAQRLVLQLHLLDVALHRPLLQLQLLAVLPRVRDAPPVDLHLLVLLLHLRVRRLQLQAARLERHRTRGKLLVVPLEATQVLHVRGCVLGRVGVGGAAAAAAAALLAAATVSLELDEASPQRLRLLLRLREAHLRLDVRLRHAGQLVLQLLQLALEHALLHGVPLPQLLLHPVRPLHGPGRLRALPLRHVGAPVLRVLEAPAHHGPQRQQHVLQLRQARPPVVRHARQRAAARRLRVRRRRRVVVRPPQQLAEPVLLDCSVEGKVPVRRAPQPAGQGAEVHLGVLRLPHTLHQPRHLGRQPVALALRLPQLLARLVRGARAARNVVQRRLLLSPHFLQPRRRLLLPRRRLLEQRLQPRLLVAEPAPLPVRVVQLPPQPLHLLRHPPALADAPVQPLPHHRLLLPQRRHLLLARPQLALERRGSVGQRRSPRRGLLLLALLHRHVYANLVELVLQLPLLQALHLQVVVDLLHRAVQTSYLLPQLLLVTVPQTRRSRRRARTPRVRRPRHRLHPAVRHRRGRGGGGA